LVFNRETGECRVSFSDERGFQIALQAKGEPFSGLVFRISFAPEITAPSLWAQSDNREWMHDPLEFDPFNLFKSI